MYLHNFYIEIAQTGVVGAGAGGFALPVAAEEDLCGAVVGHGIVDELEGTFVLQAWFAALREGGFATRPSR